jgi:hypothetical protein
MHPDARASPAIPRGLTWESHVLFPNAVPEEAHQGLVLERVHEAALRKLGIPVHLDGRIKHTMARSLKEKASRPLPPPWGVSGLR